MGEHKKHRMSCLTKGDGEWMRNHNKGGWALPGVMRMYRWTWTGQTHVNNSLGDWTNVQMEDGSRSDATIHDERTHTVPESKRAVIIVSME
jgi:hypothetical protein